MVHSCASNCSAEDGEVARLVINVRSIFLYRSSFSFGAFKQARIQEMTNSIQATHSRSKCGLPTMGGERYDKESVVDTESSMI